MVSVMRRLLGLGPSKSEQIADLKAKLNLETATLDIMAFNHPRTYREARGLPADTMEFRPGVARLEVQMAQRASTRSVKGQYDAEYHSGLYSGV